MATALPPKKKGKATSSSKKPAPPKEYTLPEMEEDLDLVQFVLRAIGVTQAIQHMGTMRRLDQNLTGYQNKNDILLDVEPSGSRPLKSSDVPRSAYRAFKATKICTEDVFRLGYTDPLTPLLPPDEVTALKMYDFRNIRAVLEAWKVKDAFETIMKNDPKENVQPIASDPLKETVYWAVTFIDKTRALIAAILGSASRLEKAGVKYWVLPTGDKVPVTSLRATILETVPSHIFSVSMQVSFESEEIDPVMEENEINFGRYVKKNHLATLVSGDRLVIRHHVLSAVLPDGSVYIVDPTGRMFGYRGFKGSLIVYGSEEEYKAHFPGVVTDQPLVHMGVKKYSKKFKGRGEAFTLELKRLLVKYISPKICAHCGLINGIHPIQIKVRPPGDAYDVGVEEESCDVSGCTGCDKVGYCSTYCQKKDWKHHKLTCTSKKEDDEEEEDSEEK